MKSTDIAKRDLSFSRILNVEPVGVGDQAVDDPGEDGQDDDRGDRGPGLVEL